jgi:ATP-dependent exoDNAse (exonuclease V) beta subunit
VHGALEAAGRGVAGKQLEAVARSLLVAAEASDDAAAPADVHALLAIVDAVTRSSVWQRAAGAHDRLVEVPFALPLPLAEYRSMVAASPDDAPLQIVEGVIDLAFRDDAGWTIVDYKSDAAGLGSDPPLLARYRAQVALYAAAWTRLTGAPVHTRIILFTATDEVDSF